MKRHLQKIKKHDEEVIRVKQILKDLDVRYSISWTEKRFWYYGTFKYGKVYVYVRWFKDVVENSKGYQIYTTRRCTVQEFLSTVFHEVGHAHQLRDGQYKTYLKGFYPKDGFKALKKWALEAYPAEKGADKIAKKLMSTYFPKIPFEGAYTGKRGRTLVLGYVASVQEACFPKTKSLIPMVKKIRIS